MLRVVGCCLIAIVMGAQSLWAQESPFARDEVDRAVDKAVGYLVGKQNDSGAITDGKHDVAMSALAIMGLASVGHLPGDPTQGGRASKKALEFVLQKENQDEHGYFGQRDHSDMYGHGIITLMLSEMLGMGIDDAQDLVLRERCQRAIDLILQAQSHPKRDDNQGGWRYKPNSNDSDLSISVWQLMALRSAKNDGLRVPSAAIDQAVEYLKRSYTSRLSRNGLPIDQQPGGFSYTPGARSPTYTMTAAGMLAMQVCGMYESPLVAGAADWLIAHPPKSSERYFHYGTYYYAQGMYQRGGKYASVAQERVATELLAVQRPDGSWIGQQESSHGSVYATSLSLLSLSVKYHFLPIYQK